VKTLQKMEALSASREVKSFTALDMCQMYGAGAATGISGALMGAFAYWKFGPTAAIVIGTLCLIGVVLNGIFTVRDRVLAQD